MDIFVRERDFAGYLYLHERYTDRDTLMRTFQEKVPEADEDLWWMVMEPVFDLR